jgi:IS30 family transposase
MVMNYCQLNLEERSALATLKRLGWSVLEMARELGRHRSTLARELKRNVTAYDGWYRAGRAHEQAVARRRRSRRNRHFGRVELAGVEALLREEWSPEQVAGYLRRKGRLLISHETIYQHVWRDWKAGGTLHLHLRGARKQCRKRYRSYDSRGRLAGKRHISERPAAVETRQRIGHWEIDTVMGESSDCVVTLVERKTGFVLIGKLPARTKEHTIAAIVMRSAGTLGASRRSPRTMEPSSIAIGRSKPRPGCASTLPRHTMPGSEAPMRTPTGSSGSIFPKAKA